MRLLLSGLWQVSPLTDLTIPQNDITFPAPLSQVLPNSLTEEAICQQEWHLMHDIEVDESMLAYPAIDLVLGGIDYHAEVRLNGVALFDCDGSQSEYQKDVRPYMQMGRNRFEILFLEEEEDFLLEEDLQSTDLEPKLKQADERLGVWKAPYLQCIRHVRLERVLTEQIWHHGGGCEFKVDLQYQTLVAGLVSASVKFDAMTYQIPIDVRAERASALFQVEAPKCASLNAPDAKDLYELVVELDGQRQVFTVALNQESGVTQLVV